MDPVLIIISRSDTNYSDTEHVTEHNDNCHIETHFNTASKTKMSIMVLNNDTLQNFMKIVSAFPTIMPSVVMQSVNALNVVAPFG